MRYEARFVVDTHVHITTLYKPKKGSPGEVEAFDNSPLCLYDMARYGVDMGILLPSAVGAMTYTQLADQLPKELYQDLDLLVWTPKGKDTLVDGPSATIDMLVEKYPDKFRACCADQTLKCKVARGEARWTLDAAVEEVEARLKTGKYVGIGEFVPSDPKKTYTYRERLDEFRTFMDLAAKYEVTLGYHEIAFITRNYGWDPYNLLSQLAREYPDVPIQCMHGGYSIGCYARGADLIRKACSVVGPGAPGGEDPAGNIYLETGTWPAEYFEIALKNPNVTATQLIWGADYGNVPQYIVAQPQYQQDPASFSSSMSRWPRVLSYQTDYWGWMFTQILKIRLNNWATQDEINLILGGNAAKIFKLPVPFERMFPEGRPDLWGIHWQKSVPFIPKDQVQHPDYP
jgi:predicted TIM-barrel fold metal-dependent hydrolase